ncbi:hypothetical protein NLU13_1505 [Sarocladium strictum]|uniref:Cupin type-1 domain-containing protein n=1 Tax=Sarocladium strictum TaxID=5046 RepID=A0AA39GTW9_SARSR|nr:hypothetical protein NLU13_1505 [Sarocladium strictum]
MVEVRKYHLQPTALMPNSPHPLLHYPGFFDASKEGKVDVAYDTLHGNGWEVQWIFRYGQTQRSHYHSHAHECMAVLSGQAMIRFGVADTSEDMEANTYGQAREEGGVELEAKAGDVFILPAGTAHKTYNAKPETEFTLLTPGDGHRVGGGEDVREALRETEGRITGFTMIGAYPRDSGPWDFQVGGEDVGAFDKVWRVPLPECDPVLGKSAEGLRGLWQ